MLLEVQLTPISDGLSIFGYELTLSLLLDYLGTLAFAISGSKLAAGKNIDWFGAFTVGLMTAVGGGTLRDLMLGETPFWLINPFYFGISVLGFFLVALFRRHIIRITKSVLVFDAIGLGVFTVVGMDKAIVHGQTWWAAIIMGVMTGAFGGLIRDICINEVPVIFKKEIYAMASFLGGIIYALLYTLDVPSYVTQLVTVVVVIGIRFLCMYYHISLPILKSDKQVMSRIKHHSRTRK